MRYKNTKVVGLRYVIQFLEHDKISFGRSWLFPGRRSERQYWWESGRTGRKKRWTRSSLVTTGYLTTRFNLTYG